MTARATQNDPLKVGVGRVEEGHVSRGTFGIAGVLLEFKRYFWP